MSMNQFKIKNTAYKIFKRKLFSQKNSINIISKLMILGTFDERKTYNQNFNKIII